MNWQPLESKLLAASAYDAGKQTLWLRFRSGDVYRYFDFPEQQYREFLETESHGRQLRVDAKLTSQIGRDSVIPSR
jgi:hypothetical protein